MVESLLPVESAMPVEAPLPAGSSGVSRADAYSTAIREPRTLAIMVALVAIIVAVASGHGMWFTNTLVTSLTALLLSGTAGLFLFRRLPPAWRRQIHEDIRSDFPI